MNSLCIYLVILLHDMFWTWSCGALGRLIVLPGWIAASRGSALDYSAWTTCSCSAAREGRSVRVRPEGDRAGAALVLLRRKYLRSTSLKRLAEHRRRLNSGRSDTRGGFRVDGNGEYFSRGAKFIGGVSGVVSAGLTELARLPAELPSCPGQPAKS